MRTAHSSHLLLLSQDTRTLEPSLNISQVRVAHIEAHGTTKHMRIQRVAAVPSLGDLASNEHISICAAVNTNDALLEICQCTPKSPTDRR